MRIEVTKHFKGRRSLSDQVSFWLINALGLLLVSKVLKGISFDGPPRDQFFMILLSSALLGLVHASLKPALLLLTLPINLLSLGLFTLVINAALLGLVAWVVPDFHIAGFGSALVGSLLLSLISLFFRAALPSGGLKVHIEK